MLVFERRNMTGKIAAFQIVCSNDKVSCCFCVFTSFNFVILLLGYAVHLLYSLSPRKCRR